MATLARLAIASVPRLAAAAIAGSILLIMPVAIWTSFGADTLLNTACVALASVLLSWAVVRQLLRPIARDTAPRRTARAADARPGAAARLPGGAAPALASRPDHDPRSRRHAALVLPRRDIPPQARIAAAAQRPLQRRRPPARAPHLAPAHPPVAGPKPARGRPEAGPKPPQRL